MKQTYSKKEAAGCKDSGYNEMTGSVKMQFPDKENAEKPGTEKQFTGEKQTDSVIIHDIFGALNY